MKKIQITLPDGKNLKLEKGTTGFEIANSISPSLAKESIAIKINGKLYDISYPIEVDGEIEIIKKNHEDALELIRHDCAHVMAEAVQSLFPNTQVTIGPAIENGFYYDFSRKEPFTIDDLEKIEKKMHKIIFLLFSTFSRYPIFAEVVFCSEAALIPRPSRLTD